MGFIMDGLDAEAYDREYSDRELVQRILRYFRPEARRMAVVAVVIVLGSAVETLIPIFISRALDRLASGITGQQMALLGLLLAGIASLGYGFNFVRRTLTTRAIGDVVLRLREAAFDAVLARDLSFYDSFTSGRIVSRVTSDSQSFSQVVTLTMELIAQLLLILFLVAYLFTVSVPLTLLLLALAPVIFAVALGFRHIARSTITQSRRVNAEVSSLTQETVSGIRVAKTFRQEAAIFDQFRAVNHQSYHVNLRTGFVFSGIFPVLNALAGIGMAALVYFGGQRAIAGSLTTGEWYLFIQGVLAFWFPLTSIASFWSQFQIGLAAGERLFALMDAEPVVVQRAAHDPGALRGDVRFDDVDFSYVPGEPVLSRFNLHIRPGESVALVGHTGSGKSSITKLVVRFYEFQGGTIWVDGQDIRELDLAAYRARIGMVTQVPFLFDGTVADNIRYGRPDATDAQVRAVAERVGQGDWLRSLPNGLASEVGERGAMLSMGQRQLVALSRVLLQDPTFFILDEATANIDPLTETLIQEGLEEVMAGRTSILIAHRLSTIRHADRIIVLRRGEIIEEGTHDSLLAAGGHYAELYNTYFRHQSLEYIEQQRDRVA